MASNRPRIIVVTANHFWLADRGSHRRIRSLLRGLRYGGMSTEVALVGDLPEGATNATHGLCSLIPLGASRPPIPPGQRLEAFSSREMATAFQRLVRSRKPDIIVIEYIHLAFLIDSVPREIREQTMLVLDTHDVMHRRSSSFRSRDKVHWLNISREEEADVISRFDLVIAIQDQEAQEFASMAPGTRVVVAPYAADTRDVPSGVTGGRCAFGFIGVNGHHNIDALNMLLDDIWPTIYETLEGKTRLVIAGPVTESCPESVPGVLRLGPVESPDDFHRQIDVLINPARIGGGLKVKNVEALCAGRPVITSEIGAHGFSPTPSGGLTIAADVDDFVRHAVALAREPGRLDDAKRGARELAEKQFHPKHAYRDLIDEFLDMRIDAAPESAA